MNVHHEILPERPSPHSAVRRLGRHIEHDSRSLAFAAPFRDGPIRTVFWERQIPVFAQGDVGSCTANACLGMLGTEPFYSGDIFTEEDCVELYKSATRLDTIPGHYLPDDTGSSGLAALKAAKRAGLISGYHHVFSFQGVLQSLQHGPGIAGVSWYEGMDTPEGDHATVKPTGQIRGGHEVVCVGLDVDLGLLYFQNSWGEEWGNRGAFTMTLASFKKLFREQGDYTVALR